MHSHLETIFGEAENRYLTAQELSLVNQYVESLPIRMEAYRFLKDHELEIMQHVADQLQAAMPQEKTENLERGIRNALLMLRYCAMGMLLNDESFVKNKLHGWLNATLSFYNTQQINTTLYRLLNQQVSAALSPAHASLITPILGMAQNLLQQNASVPALVS